MLSESQFLAFGPPKSLSERLRPAKLSEIIGQADLLRPGSPLVRLADPLQAQNPAASLILYGPPGVGKTTLAQVVAQASGRPLISLSAVTSGVKEVRSAIDKSREHRDLFGVVSILFLDEVHRFSRSQQDSLLAGVEGQEVVLVAATTQNPAYCLIAPLLSRCLVLSLSPLDEVELVELLDRALENPLGLDGAFCLDDAARSKLLSFSSGDARRLLVLLEAAADMTRANSSQRGSRENPLVLSAAVISQCANRSVLAYDLRGSEHYDSISAFIKSVRGSDPDAAIYYLARMLVGGEDPLFIARRLIILAAEDIGLADPKALQVAVAAASAVQMIGLPEARIPLAEAALFLALSPKSNSAYLAINRAMRLIEEGNLGQTPPHLQQNPPYGSAAYRYPHDAPRAVVSQNYLPLREGKILDKFRGVWEAKPIGEEKVYADRWSVLRSIVRGSDSGTGS